MAAERDLQVHLLPALVPAGGLGGTLTVVIDVLRCATTIVHALAAGCTCVRPCAEVDEARLLAGEMPVGRVLLCGERGGLPPEGFDLGNSPGDYTGKRCKGTTLVLTTSHGTRALLRGAEAERVLIGSFVNYSAVCEQIRLDSRPIALLCSGTDGEVSLEDTLFAGAVVDFLCEHHEVTLNDSARLAWDCFENHGRSLHGALELGRGGSHLKKLGLGQDIKLASQVDLFNLVPELKRDPLRVVVGSVGIKQRYWR